MDVLYKVMINPLLRFDCIAEGSLALKKNDWCIIQCHRHEDYGRVTYVGELPEQVDHDGMPRVKRQATLMDQGKANENSVRVKSMHRTAQLQVEAHKLPMQLTASHLAFDRKLAIFQFTAPERVDFRELVRDLSKALGVRVELRQIGPRDEAGMVGGLGSCGRELCCSSFLTNFVSINVKMANLQGVSLGQSNIIGACGRLKCCLNYEYDGYKKLLGTMPKIGSRCRCNGCDGVILEGNLLTQIVKVSLNGGERVVDVPVSELEHV